MSAETLYDALDAAGACGEALEWVRARPTLTAQELWDNCPRGDWLLWWASRAGVPRPTLVLAACACARTVLPYVPPGEDRPLRAIATAEAWARGEGTTKAEVLAAATVAYAAAAVAADAAANAWGTAAANAAAARAANAANAAAAAADTCTAADTCAAFVAAFAVAFAADTCAAARVIRAHIPTVPGTVPG